MEIKGKKLEELKEMAQIQIEEYEQELNWININQSIYNWDNECKIDDYNQKIEVLKAFVELVNLKIQEREN